jgi:hypothetical protein
VFLLHLPNCLRFHFRESNQIRDLLDSLTTLQTEAFSGNILGMNEIIFEVREAEEGGFWARALGYSIFTQGEDWDDLRSMVKDAVKCHFDHAEERPGIIRLHFVRDEVLAA